MSPIAPTPVRKPGRAPAILLALAGLLPVGAGGVPTAADRELAAATRQVEPHATPDALVALSAAFMRKARETGDASHYERAAAALDRAVAIDGDHYGALRTRAWVLLGKHEFRPALRAARAARRRAPADWWNYGNLADACVELGYYRGAWHATARMAALRPGVPSYARVAALRALSGDRHGAIEALELAMAAADRSDPEGVAWLLTHLGHEHWALGEVASAARRYEAALAILPDYHLALPALARVRAVEGRRDDAIGLYERALAVAPLPATAGALGDLHAAAGNPIRARAAYDFAMYMGRVASARGQLLGRELALFLADHDRDLDEALRLARADAAMRDDVYTADALAWTLFKRGELRPAKRAMARALRLGTEERAFHRHAAAIATALGKPRAAERHADFARRLEPVDPDVRTAYSRGDA
jgi:tetratricopeptide (TPR) repeat protein